MSTYENLLLEKEDGIALVTVNRPKVLNALNGQTFQELNDLFDALENDEEVAVIVVTGSGKKSFVAGADINELTELTAQEGQQLAERGQKVFSKIENFKKPVIAAINGFALGGGLEFALACHIRIAATEAKLGLPETKLGLIPGYGGTQRLARLVGKGIAIELVLNAGMIDSERASKIGLLNKVVDGADLLATAKGMAKNIMNNGPLAVSMAIEAINLGLETTIERGLKHESHIFGLLCSTEDKKEGTSAFLEKRKPEFKNR